jgi:predicted nucleic acid-binding protein
VIVVADTSVILNLACVGYDHLLHQLYRDVRIPPTVADEFRSKRKINTRFRSLTIPTWIREQSVIQIPASVTSIPGLDAGEAEAIALEIRADALLIDAFRSMFTALAMFPTVFSHIIIMYPAYHSSSAP